MILTNTEYFLEARKYFQEFETYTRAPIGSYAYREYWLEENRRCLEGYKVGDLHIPGTYYFYLNFTQIPTVNPITNRKERGFPLFTDVDLEFFKNIELARAQKKGFIFLKPRRIGASEKNASLVNHEYTFYRDSKCLIGAFQSDLSENTMRMCLRGLNFLDKETEWRRERNPDTNSFVQARYKRTENGIEVWRGYNSSIERLTFKDNPFAAIGRSSSIFLIEEAGRFPNLISSYNISEPCWKNGDDMIGLPVLYGCVCAGTKVWTKEGKLVNIENLRQEDGILGFNNGSSRESIIWMKPPAKKPCYRIETYGGNVIECSEDHPLLWTKRKYQKEIKEQVIPVVEFKKTCDVKVGDYLLFNDRMDNFGNIHVENARLLGMMIGDGYYGTNTSISIDDENTRKFILSNYKTTIKREFITKTGTVFSEYSLIGVRNLLREAGIYGQSKFTKRLPLDIHTYSKESLSQLLAGYFDADGNVYYNKAKNTTRIVLTGIVKELLEQVKFELLKFGINSSIVKEKRNTEPTEEYKGQQPFIYRLYISKDEDVIRFRENIPIIASNKAAALSKATKGNRDHGRFKRAWFNFKEDFPKGAFYKENNLLNNLRYETVTSVTFIGERDVYNLNAGTTHTYLANNFITSNTGGDMEGGTADFAEMFYNPSKYNLLAFDNIWDGDTSKKQCGWFIPANRMRFGTYQDPYKEFPEYKGVEMVDKDGNSNIEVATQSILDFRKSKTKGRDPKAVRDATTQYPLCISPDTLISRNGKVDRICNFTDKIDNGIADIYQLKTENGRQLKATLRHHIFNGNEYKELGEYKIGESIKLFKTDFSNNSYQTLNIKTDLNLLNSDIVINEELAWLIGLYMGDGSFYGKDFRYELEFACDKQDVDLTEKLGLLLKKLFRNVSRRVTGTKQGGLNLRITDKNLIYVVKALDLIKHDKWGTLKRHVHVPEYIYKSPKTVVSAFLQGLFEADAFIATRNKLIRIVQKDPEFLKQIQVLLQGFEIYGKLKEYKKYLGKTEYAQASIELTASEADSFYRSIGFTSKRKMTLLAEHCKNESKLVRDNSFDKIVSIEYCSTGQVYDISDVNNCYGANGIWVHNSTEEGFLISKGAKFPIDIQYRLAELESKEIYKNAEYIGRLIIEDNKIVWKNDPSVKPICSFPITDGEHKEGGIVIYEMPYEKDGQVPSNMYIAGIDPYDFDTASYSDSLGSTLVYNRITQRIVAEYTARPELASEYYENTRRLLMFYNAVAMYENDKKGLFTYFDNKHCTYLLADSPKIVKDIIKDSRVSRGKGTHANVQLKLYAIEAWKNWLLSSHGDLDSPEDLNLHRLRSIPFLKEMLLYNDEGNFDRVDAACMLAIYMEELGKYPANDPDKEPEVAHNWSKFTESLYRKRMF